MIQQVRGIEKDFPARLVLDVQAIQSEEHSERGIARYVAMMCTHLRPYLNSIEAFCLNPHRPYPRKVAEDLLISGKLVWGSMVPIREAAAKGPVVYWRMSPFEMPGIDDTIHPRNILGSGAVIVAILYDLIPLLFPEVYLKNPVVKVRYAHHLEMLKASDLLLAISESAKADAVNKLAFPPEKIAVIKAGVSGFFNATDSAELDRDILRVHTPQLSRPYLFSVMGEDPRKNLDGLLKAYRLLPAKLRETHQLVIGGSYRKETIENIKESVPSDIAERLIIPSYVDDYTMRALYRNSALFVFPSKYEGFGLPLVEAVACGAAAICSNTSSLPEILDYPEATFDPENAEEMARLIERGLSDRDFAQTVRQIGRARVPLFQWSQVVEESMRAISSTVPRTGGNCRLTRPAVALVGPFPPQRSGIANYNYHFARELALSVDLFVFHVGTADAEPLWSAGIMVVRPIEELGRKFSPHYFDRVLYTVGNSDHHVVTYHKFLEHPGVLWLHDVHLSGLYNVIGTVAAGNGGSFLLEQARHIYGYRCPPPVLHPGPSLAEDLKQWSIHYAGELAKHAQAVIVQSQLAHDMLRLDCGASVVLPPVYVLPHATNRGYAAEPVTPIRATARAIVSLGFVDPVKAPHLLIRAFAALPSELAAQLVFVGDCPDRLRKELTDLAAALGVHKATQFLGYTDESVWFEQIRSATCAVQLRLRSNGESSGAVLDCVSMGLPVITNVASCREMPDDSVLMVSPDCSIMELKERLAELLTDDELQLRMRAGALAYADAHSFEKTVRQLLTQLFRGNTWDSDPSLLSIAAPGRKPPQLHARQGPSRSAAVPNSVE
jgi:glycosyltransferase involved in cell wall biosynthesis